MKLKKVLAIALLPALVLGVAFYILACGGEAGGDSEKVARSYLLNSDTFKFDGQAGTVKLVNRETLAGGAGERFTFTFQTGHYGHGDREGLVILPVITDHRIELVVANGRVTEAICCDGWDEIAGKYAETADDTRTAEGEFVGLADSHTAEFIIGEEYRSFGLAAGVDFSGLAEGDLVKITYYESEEGRPVIVEVEKIS